MSAGRAPKVSVVMAVHNGAPFVAEALSSILSQTFTDLEVIVVDDGSSDNSAAEVIRVSDARVTLLRLEHPSGDLAVALDEGVRRSRGQYIARMDADDISYPARLERQLATMEARPDLVLLGTWVDALDRDSRPTMVSRPPCEDAAIRFILNYRCTYHHPSVMLRRDALEAAGGYRAGYRYAEDYDLWRRLIQHGRAANLPEVLLGQRYYSTSSSGRFRNEQAAQSDRIGMEMVASAVGHEVSPSAVRALREQAGPPYLLRLAGETLLELYNACAARREFEFAEPESLRATAAREMADMASAGSGRTLVALWAKAFRLHPETAAKRARDSLRGWRDRRRPA